MALEKSTRLLLWISALGFLIFGAAIVAVGLIVAGDDDLLAGFGRGGGDEQGEWLYLHLEGPIGDGPMPDSLIVDPEDIPLTVHDYAATLHEAARDEGVAGLDLELDMHGLGFASAQEIRGGLVAMKDAGKPCRAWSKIYENVDWYIASACDELHIHPEGVPMAIGLKVQTSYYAGTFEKLGVSGDFERVGRFKSAIETYERTAPSESSMLMYDELLDSLYANFVADVADGRQLSEDDVRELIDDPPVTAKTAVDRGMLDAMTYRDAWAEAHPEPTPFKKYAAQLQNRWRRSGKQVAVVHLSGQIMDGESSSGGFGGAVIGDASVVPMLDRLAEDEDVVAVVLRVDSPGGSALASDVMWRSIVELKEEKPVVVSMASYAASGGYYIAMPADYIFAQPSTITGSIGVFGGKFAMAGLYEKIGVTTWSSQRGELAMLYNLERPFSDAERSKVRERIEAFYDTFVTKAGEGRGMTWAEIDEVAGGRVWTGSQALEVGLVDELGGIEQAVAKALELAGEESAEDIGRRILPRRQSLMEYLLKGLNEQQVQATRVELQQEAIRELVGPELVDTLAYGQSLQRALAGGGIAAMDPVRVTVR
jgi:protease-4